MAPLREWERDDDKTDVGPFATWREMHAATVQGRLRFLKGTEFEDLIPVVERYCDSYQHLIDYALAPRLLHMDLHPGNMLVSDGRVSGILDVEEAVVGHNEYDLMRTELANFRDHSPRYTESFMQAYQRHVPLDEGYESRRLFYDVSRTLVWMKSLVAYGDAHAKGAASQSGQAARRHLLALTRGPEGDGNR